MKFFIKEMIRGWNFRISIALIIVPILLVASAILCNNSLIEVQEDIKNVSALTYEIIKIEGMTCIKWDRLFSYKGALTCNWDEWEK